MSHDPITRHFVSSVVRLHALRRAADGPTCGAEIAGLLARHGYPVSRRRLSHALCLLERLGCLSSRIAVARGQRRRYYRATPAGQKALEEAGKKLLELTAEVIGEGGRPPRGARRKRRRAPPSVTLDDCHGGLPVTPGRGGLTAPAAPS
jgi:DNA-binding PadR family transcriptional regulator